MKQKKESPKIELFEKTEITNEDIAKQVAETEKKWLIFRLVCTILALIPTIFFLVPESAIDKIPEYGFWDWFFGAILISGWIGMLICAYKIVFKLFSFLIRKGAWIGYMIVPYVGWDMLGGFMGGAIGFGLAAACVAFFPAAFCLPSLIQSYMNYKNAKAYLEYETAANSVQGQ